MNKRAISEHGIFTIIFGVISVIAIIFIFGIPARLFGLGEQHTAVTSLRSLQQAVLKTLAQTEQFYAVRNHPLFIQSNAFIIVAFNAEDDEVQSGCYEETATRPAACLKDKACLCLYEDTAGQDFDDDGSNQPIKCEIFPKNVVFLAPANEREEVTENNNPVDKWNYGKKGGSLSVKAVNDAGGYGGLSYPYENFLIYGQCSTFEWWGMSLVSAKSTVWNNQPVYIERLVDGPKFYVYVARESPFTQQRHEALRKLYGITIASIKQKMAQGAYAEAIFDAKDFIEARGKDPQVPEMLLLQGVAFEKIAGLPEADGRAQLDLLMKKQPLLWLDIRHEKWQDVARIRALTAYTELVKLYPQSEYAVEARIKGIPLLEKFGPLARATQWRKELVALQGRSDESDLQLIREEARSLASLVPDQTDDSGPWLRLMSRADEVRADIEQFLTRWPQSPLRKEALYLLAEINEKYPQEKFAIETQVPVWKAIPLADALQAYARIMREFKTDWKTTVKINGESYLKDAKAAIERLCKNEQLAKECKTLSDEGLVAQSGVS